MTFYLVDLSFTMHKKQPKLLNKPKNSDLVSGNLLVNCSSKKARSNIPLKLTNCKKFKV